MDGNPDDMPELSAHAVEFYRHSSGNDVLFISGSLDYTSRLGIALHVYDSITEMAHEWNESNNGTETFPEYYLEDFVNRGLSKIELDYHKQIMISSFSGYSVKYHQRDEGFEEPYQNRVTIWTLFEIGDMVLEFQMNSWEEEVEEVEEYYDHLIKTFSISE